mgnify:CR=1 FL=1
MFSLQLIGAEFLFFCRQRIGLIWCEESGNFLRTFGSHKVDRRQSGHPSHQKNSVLRPVRRKSDLLHLSCIVIAQSVKTKTVGFWINQCSQFGFEQSVLCRIQHTFKDGVLNSLAIINTNFGHFAQTSPAGSCLGVHIIGDKNQHRITILLPEKRRIPFQISAQGTGQQKGLDVGDKPPGNLFAEKWMLDCLLFALLPCSQESTPSFIG